MSAPRAALRDPAILCLLVLSLSAAGCVLAHGQAYESFTTPVPLEAGDCLVLGFQGGVEAWDSQNRGVTMLALELRAREVPGLRVETVENRKRDLALQLIRRAFDRNGDATLDEQERRSVRLIVYGVSFGGAAVVKLARQLHAMDIPVLLTVQVDSVGRGDAVIPPNVAAAANLFQSNGRVIRGEPAIRAEDPASTTILGSFRFDYRDREIDLSGVSWHKRLFRVAHAKMGVDPAVWDMVEKLVLSAVSWRPFRPAGRRAGDAGRT